VADGLDREQLRQSLGTLSDPQRQAILLVFDDGYTFAEAALILEVLSAVINLRRSMHADT
jgi:DNA-directed RNA polymerase specialized sigma24 family protein